MGSIYERDGRLYLSFKDHDGKWRNQSAGLAVGQEKQAAKLLREVEEHVRARQESGGLDASGDLTVARFAEWWLSKRNTRTVANDRTRLELHALPRLGRMKLEDVRARHLLDLVADLQAGGKLAPRTIRHVYGTLAVMLRSAVKRGLLQASPAVLGKGDLPKIADKDPSWRQTAVFSKAEAAALMYDARVLADRRVFYALKYLGAMRQGEAAGLRWSDIAEASPLDRITIARSYEGPVKTDRPRAMPVHPALAAILESWLASGWEATYGRAPKPEDLVVPTRRFGMRNDRDAQTALHLDLTLLGLRLRRGHDLRRSLISHAQEDGAAPHVLKLCTHGDGQDIIGQYTTISWQVRCAELAKLQVMAPPAVEAFCTLSAAASGETKLLGVAGTSIATPEGFEAGFSPQLANAGSGGRPAIAHLRVVEGGPRRPVVGSVQKTQKGPAGVAGALALEVDPVEDALAEAVAGWHAHRDAAALRRALLAVLGKLG